MALFNLCFARAHGGRFLLRIEDTDRARSTPQFERDILDSLRWLGLEWDEGPDVGGDHGPYRQSECGDSYVGYAEQLVEQGSAFYCYRSPEELQSLRESRRAAGLSSALKPSDLRLDEDEIARRRAAGQHPVIRMMVPEEEGNCVVQDLLRGSVELDWSMVDAQVLLKSDGMPTYHLANVVDDHRMGISHVLRGEEWLNSTPKHQLLYQYFGWEPPQWCHLPLLRNPDHSKLSKRNNPTSILYYRRMGFLPQALLNYLGRMGWSMPDGREKFSLAEMMENFDIQRVSLGGPVFDPDKLRWLNGLWIRENCSDRELAERLQEWAFNRELLQAVIPHVRSRMETLSDFAPLVSFLVAGELPIEEADFAACRGDSGTHIKSLQFLLWRLESQQQWERSAILADAQAIAGALEIRMKYFLAPLFVAITGSTASFSVIDAMVLLGPDLSRARMLHAIEVLGGLSNKGRKKLAREYAQLD